MTSMMQNPQGDGDCGGGGGGGRIFVMQAMRSPSERYLSSESLENDRNSTTSSTESPNGTVTHRKDHEFIPTRVKTINASRPAADPSKFTKVPSNPLLVSAHQQLKQAEEIKKKKKESTQLKVKRGDEEPDWQSNLSSWKSRRRKQSEDALQRMAEVKALEDGQKTGQPRKISIGKKLSSLLYTSGEDLDWSEMGLDKDDEQSDDERLRADANEGKSPQRRDSDLLSRSASREEDTSSDKDSKQQPEWTSSKVQNWMEVIRQDAPRKSASQPLVTYSQRNVESVPNGSSQQQQPQVRRKSSELSLTMKTRLEAFNDVGGGGGGVVENAPKPTVAGPIEPDQQFHQKLMAFRRISEGNLEQRQEELMKPKPPQSIGSLLGGQQNVSQSNARTLGSPPLTPEDSPRNNGRNNEDYENDTLEDVDQLLDDALEESYRSVLEDRPASKVFADTDFVRKDAPLEKPPPPPPPTTTTAKGNSKDDDDDVDQQEREIIASLEIEEREHNRYISEKMKRLPTPSSSSSSSVAIYDDSGISSSGKHPPNRQDVLSSDRSRRNNLRNETDFKKNNYNSAQKRQPNEQRAYDQHWLIQEAEQRRRQDSAKQKSTNGGGSSIVARDGQRQNMAATTTEISPVYENSLYVNQQPRQLQHTTIIPSASSNNSVGLVSAPAHNENVYANLSSQSSDQLVGSRDGRKPGPRVPPRSQHDPIQSGSKGERVLSVSGRKRCSHCKEELGRGAAMIIESLRLYYHLKCFQCCVCQIQLGNGVSGTDVRVRNNKLHCQNCYSNDEGLKFSKV